MNTAEYHTSRYFIGMRVEVKIPLLNNDIFSDWAIVNEINEDLVSLQLSRDILPEGVSLHVGQELTINSQSDGNSYSCRAYLVSKGHEQDLLLRFASERASNQLREFYRVDAFLPIKFYVLYDQNPANVKNLWEAQRKQRRDEETTRERQRFEANKIRRQTEERERMHNIHGVHFPRESGAKYQDKLQEIPQNNQYYETWGDVTSLAVNISGGGLKIFINMKFNIDELILLEAYVPSSQSIVDIIARVVFSDDDKATENSKFGSTAVQFVFIDESSRSAINSHISNIQLRRIRHFKGFADVDLYNKYVSVPGKHYAYIDTIDVCEDTDNLEQIRKFKIQQLLLVLLFVCIICLLLSNFHSYEVKRPKNEIQNMFDNSITKLKKD